MKSWTQLRATWQAFATRDKLPAYKTILDATMSILSTGLRPRLDFTFPGVLPLFLRVVKFRLLRNQCH